jgi:hypothetical protein
MISPYGWRSDERGVAYRGIGSREGNSVDEDTRSALYVGAGVLAVSFFRLNPAAARIVNYLFHSPLLVYVSVIVVIVAFVVRSLRS